MASLGECDSCGRGPRLVRLQVAYGMEGCFCSECRGGSLADDIDELEEMVDALPPLTRADQAWADTIAAENALIEARSGGGR